jgi:uncharacterized membrane protein YvbJ
MASFCPNCGFPQGSASSFCSKCGARQAAGRHTRRAVIGRRNDIENRSGRLRRGGFGKRSRFTPTAARATCPIRASAGVGHSK